MITKLKNNCLPTVRSSVYTIQAETINMLKIIYVQVDWTNIKS